MLDSMLASTKAALEHVLAANYPGATISPSFIPYAAWAGPMTSYVFKTGALGLGYYRWAVCLGVGLRVRGDSHTLTASPSLTVHSFCAARGGPTPCHPTTNNNANPQGRAGGRQPDAQRGGKAWQQRRRRHQPASAGAQG